jgi:aminoglycoside phosphotransferase (APT) family kinase protein
MKVEPAIDREQLGATIRRAYGIAVEELTFVPVGYASACYTARAAGGARYFLKLWPDTHAGRSSAARRDASLALTRALHDRRLDPRVPCPIPTRSGALSSSFGGQPFAVFPFLAGAVLPDWPDLPVGLRDELARSVAALHRATPSLADVLPPRESFELPFDADLRRALDTIARLGPGERPGRLALRERVLPRRDEILDQLARLHLLQSKVRRLAGPVVLCHTDLGGDNNLVDDHGRIVFLDWDTATLAPPEFDLWSVVGDGFDRFLDVYREAGGAYPLHLDHFAFALLRRYVEDLTARLLRILDEETTEDEDRELLAGLETWGFSRWAALDRTLEVIAEVLPHQDLK